MTRRVINVRIYSSIQNNLKSPQRCLFLPSRPFYAFAKPFRGALADRPLGRSGGSQAWWWGPRWPPRRGRHTPTRRHASCGTGRPSPSGNSSLDARRRGQNWSQRHPQRPFGPWSHVHGCFFKKFTFLFASFENNSFQDEDIEILYRLRRYRN